MAHDGWVTRRFLFDVMGLEGSMRVIGRLGGEFWGRWITRGGEIGV